MSAATGADRLEVAPAAALVGELALPGDKSISHRALLLGAVADGATEISGFGPNADTLATLAAVESLGARVERLDEAGTRLRVHGCGLRGLKAPDGAIDVRNAGTLMRLLPGLLVGQTGSFTLDGDESIRRRPVDRVAMPLRLMGAVLGDSDGGRPCTSTAAASCSRSATSFRWPPRRSSRASCSRASTRPRARRR